MENMDSSLSESLQNVSAGQLSRLLSDSDDDALTTEFGNASITGISEVERNNNSSPLPTLIIPYTTDSLSESLHNVSLQDDSVSSHFMYGTDCPISPVKVDEMSESLENCDIPFIIVPPRARDRIAPADSTMCAASSINSESPHVEPSTEYGDCSTPIPLHTSTPSRNRPAPSLTSQTPRSPGNLSESLYSFDESWESDLGSPDGDQDQSFEVVRPRINIAEEQKTSRSKVSQKYANKTNATSAMLVFGSKCCPANCMGKISARTIRSSRQVYWGLDRQARKQWLLDKLGHFSNKGRRSYVNINSIMSVCQEGFMRMYGVSRSTFFRTKREFADGSRYLLPPTNNRQQESATILAQLWCESHFSLHGDRMPHKDEVLLPFGIVKADIYGEYKDDIEAKDGNPISKSHFMKVWRCHFPKVKIKKANDNFSKCTKCVMFTRALKRNHDVLERHKIRRLRKLHLLRQRAERLDYYRKRDKARENPEEYLSLIIDGMDQAKTYIPHFIGRKAKAIRSSDLMKTHLTAVIDHGGNQVYTFLDKAEFPHDSNLTNTILLDTLWMISKKGRPLQPTLFLQADNCWRENKNKYVLAICEILVSLQVFKEIQYSFLYVGHTHEDIDQYFSQLARVLRIREADTLPEMMTLLHGVRELKSVPDFKTWMEPILNTVSGHTRAQQFKFTHSSTSSNLSHVVSSYRGNSTAAWQPMGSLLRFKPGPRFINKRPSNVLPDFDSLNLVTFEMKLKNWAVMFDPSDDSSLNWWKCFINELKNATSSERKLRLYGNRDSRWHLPRFASYRKRAIRQAKLPMEEIIGRPLLAMLQQETAEPQVTVSGPNSGRKKTRIN